MHYSTGTENNIRQANKGKTN